MAPLGRAGRGRAGLGMALHGGHRQVRLNGMERQASYGLARPGLARRGRQRIVWHRMVGHGKAGMATRG